MSCGNTCVHCSLCGTGAPMRVLGQEHMGCGGSFIKIHRPTSKTTGAQPSQPVPTTSPHSENVAPNFISAFVLTTADQERAGLAAYGTTLNSFNGRDAGRDAFEKYIDLGKYLTQLRMEHLKLQQAMSAFLDDMRHGSVMSRAEVASKHAGIFQELLA